MEQIRNFEAATLGEAAGGSQNAFWRSVGSVAAALVARAAAEQSEDVRDVDLPYVPVAWAAE